MQVIADGRQTWHGRASGSRHLRPTCRLSKMFIQQRLPQPYNLINSFSRLYESTLLGRGWVELWRERIYFQSFELCQQKAVDACTRNPGLDAIVTCWGSLIRGARSSTKAIAAGEPPSASCHPNSRCCALHHQYSQLPLSNIYDFCTEGIWVSSFRIIKPTKGRLH